MLTHVAPGFKNKTRYALEPRGETAEAGRAGPYGRREKLAGLEERERESFFFVFFSHFSKPFQNSFSN